MGLFSKSKTAKEAVRKAVWNDYSSHRSVRNAKAFFDDNWSGIRGYEPGTAPTRAERRAAREKRR